MAAYPVLLPAYLVQYNVDTVIDNDLKTVTLTSFIEASHDEVSSPFLRPRVHAYIANVCKPRMIVEVVEVVADWFKLLGRQVPDVVVRGPNAVSLSHFGVVRSLLAGSPTLNHKRRLERWIDSVGASMTALPSYRERYFGKTEAEAARAINWEDVRIRPYTAEEREANWRYMAAGEELFFVKQVSLAYERRREVSQPAPRLVLLLPTSRSYLLMRCMPRVERGLGVAATRRWTGGEHRPCATGGGGSHPEAYCRGGEETGGTQTRMASPVRDSGAVVRRAVSRGYVQYGGPAYRSPSK